MFLCTLQGFGLFLEVNVRLQWLSHISPLVFARPNSAGITNHSGNLFAFFPLLREVNNEARAFLSLNRKYEEEEGGLTTINKD